MSEKVPWKVDSDQTSCEQCEKPFGVLRRKHHCRRCGGIYCNECCAERVKGIMGYGDTPQRVCIACRDTLAAIKETGSLRPRERRMIVVGAHQCGKTSVCCAIDKALGDPSAANRTKPVKYRGSEYSIHVVDVDGGPEIFRPSCTVGVHAFVILFNIGDRTSYISAQQLLERILICGPSRLMVFTGHKMDGISRVISTEEGKGFASKNGCVYRELSSRSHHEAVDFLNDIVARIADSET